MNQLSFLAFEDELSKIAGRVASFKFLDDHLRADKKDKDWKTFDRKVLSAKFRDVAKNHELSDAKLKKYVENWGGYKTSDKVVGVVPSRTRNRLYRIKELSNGRLGCGCADWKYVHSVNGTNCDHIDAYKEKA